MLFRRETARVRLPSPMVARKMAGLNVRVFLEAAVTFITLDYSPTVRVEFGHLAKWLKSRKWLECRCLVANAPWFGGDLFVRSEKAAVSMRFRARLAGGQFTLFSWPCPACGAPQGQRLLLGSSHHHIIRISSPGRWSNLTIGKTDPDLESRAPLRRNISENSARHSTGNHNRTLPCLLAFGDSGISPKILVRSPI